MQASETEQKLNKLNKHHKPNNRENEHGKEDLV